MRTSLPGTVCAALLMATLLVWLGATPSQATVVYRGSDGQGATLFSDRPVPGGVRVELEPLSVVPLSRVAAPVSPATPAAAASGAPLVAYSRLHIAAPRDEETLPSGAAGNMQVQLAIEPALDETHRLRLLVDGQAMAPAIHADTLRLTNLERGERVLQVELLDASGEVRQRSTPVTLYVQRASINLPQNPRSSH